MSRALLGREGSDQDFALADRGNGQCIVLAPRPPIRVPDFPASIERYTIRIRLHVVRNSSFLATPISYRDIGHIGARPSRS